LAKFFATNVSKYLFARERKKRYGLCAASINFRIVHLTAVLSENSTPLVRAGLQDVLGGTISGVVSIVYCVSYAAFIFSGPLAPWLGYGIAATFISTTVGALVVALRSSLPFTIAGPDSSTSVVTAALVAAFVEWLVANGTSDHILEPTLILMALSSVLIGILLCGLGLGRAGRAIRFVPYPVIGGFLGATGWLMVSGASRPLQPI